VLTLDPVEARRSLDVGGAGQLVLELDGRITPLAIRNPARLDDVSLLMPIRLT
jgi:hypothetical protein